MCAIGRSPSKARRTPRWISSSGYFFGRAMAAERLLPRGQNPRFEVSAKPGLAHGAGRSVERAAGGVAERGRAGGFEGVVGTRGGRWRVGGREERHPSR